MELSNYLYFVLLACSLVDVKLADGQDLCVTDLEWKPFDELTSQDYLVPTEPAVVNGNSLHICRIYVNGDLLIGKASVEQKSCWVPYQNIEVGSSGSLKFEVLTSAYDLYQWGPMSKGGEIPYWSISGGHKERTGGVFETYYIARCYFEGRVIAGTLHGNTGTMFVAWGGKAYECENFEVLRCKK